jgi:hypothetical protein
MPNQRAKTKALLGAFIDRRLKAALIAVAKEKGLTASDAMTAAIHEYVTRNTSQSSGQPASSYPPPTTASDPADIVGLRMHALTDSPPEPAAGASVDEVWLL